jgi:hypothetical protein
MRSRMWRAVSRCGIQSTESLRRFIGSIEGKAHHQTLASEQDRRQAVVHTRVCDYTDAFEKAALF